MNYIAEKKKSMMLIVKPCGLSQGKGIFLTRKLKDIPRDQCHVVQQYKSMPYLINGKKFDFRIYVLVTQVVPEMQVFIYKDGLARFATENYVNNYEENLFMHLTNYAINKESEKFEGNEDEFKKTMSETLQIIEEEQGPNGPKIIEKLKE